MVCIFVFSVSEFLKFEKLVISKLGVIVVFNGILVLYYRYWMFLFDCLLGMEIVRVVFGLFMYMGLLLMRLVGVGSVLLMIIVIVFGLDW